MTFTTCPNQIACQTSCTLCMHIHALKFVNWEHHAKQEMSYISNDTNQVKYKKYDRFCRTWTCHEDLSWAWTLTAHPPLICLAKAWPQVGVTRSMGCSRSIVDGFPLRDDNTCIVCDLGIFQSNLAVNMFQNFLCGSTWNTCMAWNVVKDFFVGFEHLKYYTTLRMSTHVLPMRQQAFNPAWQDHMHRCISFCVIWSSFWFWTFWADLEVCFAIFGLEKKRKVSFSVILGLLLDCLDRFRAINPSRSDCQDSGFNHF